MGGYFLNHQTMARNVKGTVESVEIYLVYRTAGFKFCVVVMQGNTDVPSRGTSMNMSLKDH